jgi:hypothetical protein
MNIMKFAFATVAFALAAVGFAMPSRSDALAVLAMRESLCDAQGACTFGLGGSTLCREKVTLDVISAALFFSIKL